MNQQRLRTAIDFDFMNAPASAGSGLTKSNATSPTSATLAYVPGGFGVSSPLVSPTKSQKRHLSNAALSSSAGSGEDVEDDNGIKKRTPGVKRACNECRQQKVSSSISVKSMDPNNDYFGYSCDAT